MAQYCNVEGNRAVSAILCKYIIYPIPKIYDSPTIIPSSCGRCIWWVWQGTLVCAVHPVIQSKFQIQTVCLGLSDGSHIWNGTSTHPVSQRESCCRENSENNLRIMNDIFITMTSYKMEHLGKHRHWFMLPEFRKPSLYVQVFLVNSAPLNMTKSSSQEAPSS